MCRYCDHRAGNSTRRQTLIAADRVITRALCRALRGRCVIRRAIAAHLTHARVSTRDSLEHGATVLQTRLATSVKLAGVSAAIMRLRVGIL